MKSRWSHFFHGLVHEKLSMKNWQWSTVVARKFRYIVGSFQQGHSYEIGSNSLSVQMIFSIQLTVTKENSSWWQGRWQDTSIDWSPSSTACWTETEEWKTTEGKSKWGSCLCLHVVIVAYTPSTALNLLVPIYTCNHGQLTAETLPKKDLFLWTHEFFNLQFLHFDPLSPFQCCNHLTVSTEYI